MRPSRTPAEVAQNGAWAVETSINRRLTPPVVSRPGRLQRALRDLTHDVIITSDERTRPGYRAGFCRRERRYIVGVWVVFGTRYVCVNRPYWWVGRA